MKQVTKLKYEIYFREFEYLGSFLEEAQEKVKELPFGCYSIDHLDSEKKIALKILEGMIEFQRKNNKGVRFSKLFDDSIEIFDINAQQKVIDEQMKNFSI
jgi:hypothetical protein